jgi:hypothetical protein
MQCPKAPNVTEELRMSVKFVSMTLRMAMSPMTGDEMVVTRRRMDAMKMKTTPTLFQWSDVSCAFATNRSEGRRTNGLCEPWRRSRFSMTCECLSTTAAVLVDEEGESERRSATKV